MRKWFILIVILLIGLTITAGVWVFVKTAPLPDDAEKPAPGGFISFFGQQFGFGDDTPGPATPDTDPAVETPRPSFREILREETLLPLSTEIVSGVTFTASTTATSTPSGLIQIVIEHARFVERETGHVYDFSLDSGNTRRVTNTTIPRIQEAVWGRNGSAVALRYLADDNETVETYVGPLPTDPYASTTELFGTFFPQNIPSLAFSPTTNEAFYLTTTNTGATGRIASVSGTNSRVVFFSPLREWVAAWTAPTTMFVTTKPSFLAVGNSERVTTNGTTNTALRGIVGLTTLPNWSASRILYSTSASGTLRLFIYDTTTRESLEFLVPTLPEKCVWMDDVRVICAVPDTIPSGMPDLWYQGGVSFNDTFWMLDATTGQVDFLFRPEETPARERVDAINLSLSYDDSILSFINKKDLHGWLADVLITNN